MNDATCPGTAPAAGLGSSPSTVPPLAVPGPHRNVAERLAELAIALPDHTALESWDGALTFAELDARVRAIAAQLGGGPPVGIQAEQSTASIAALLGVMTAARAAVVLDLPLPDARLGQIAQQAGLTSVIADEQRRAAATLLPGVREFLELETLGRARRRDGAPLPAVGLDDPASLVYTSGSTGAPKGVTYTHATLLASGYNGLTTWEITPADRLALVMPAAFAAGQITLCGGLLNGATVCVRDPRIHGLADLVRWLRSERITVMVCAPALMRAIHNGLDAGEVLSTVRLMVTGGEKVYGRDVEAFREHLEPRAVYQNWVGASETGSLAAFDIAPADPVPAGVVPVGRAVAFQELELLDEHGAPTPPGEVGLLHATSAFLAGGYWGDPARTDAKFQRLADGRVRYGTGDKGRCDERGDLHLVGRSDDSVKIRGYLVEPGEVEGALVAMPDVRDAVVRARPTELGEERLISWVEPNPVARTPSPAGLRAALARTLPDWMVPRDVVLLEAMPRTERGKIDVSRLPPVPERPEPVPPQSGDEAAVERIWASVLHLERVGRDESFTALGGDSLAVEEMLAAVSGRLGVALVTADLAEHPTLSEFAAVVSAAAADGPAVRASTLVQLRRTGTRPPLFCFAGAGGAASGFEPLAGALGPDQPVHAFQVQGLESRGVPDWTVGRTARRYLGLIEQLAPDGPVLLAGHSLGGLFGLAVANMLAARGRDVPLLTLIDTYLPLTVRGRDAPRHLGPASRPLSRRELWRIRLRVLGAGIVRYEPELQKEVFHQHGARIARHHRPSPWPGRSLLIMSNENEDDPRWWERLLVGEHDQHVFDCDHVALLRRPYADRVAALMLAAGDM